MDSCEKRFLNFYRLRLLGGSLVRLDFGNQDLCVSKLVNWNWVLCFVLALGFPIPTFAAAASGGSTVNSNFRHLLHIAQYLYRVKVVPCLQLTLKIHSFVNFGSFGFSFRESAVVFFYIEFIYHWQKNLENFEFNFEFKLHNYKFRVYFRDFCKFRV